MTDRYSLFAWDYELFNPVNQKAVGWYLSHINQSGGPVLELACGTGRLMAEIAKNGFEIDGLDLSPEMLKIAQSHHSQLPDDTKSRLRLTEGDMTDFKLDKKYGTFIIADNSFTELTNDKARLNCLDCIKNHLKPDGQILAAVRRWKESDFKNGLLDSGWSKTFKHPETGKESSRRSVTQLDPQLRTVTSQLTYQFGDQTHEFTRKYDWLDTKDYKNVFNQADYRTEFTINYSDQPDDQIHSVLCIRAGLI